MNEKCYISRDEDDDKVWVWRKPSRGLWSPVDIGGKESVNFQRHDRSLENADCYNAADFKNKFGTNISQKTKKCVYLSVKALNSEDYKLFSNNKNRKKQ